MTNRDKGEGGSKIDHFRGDVIFEWPLICCVFVFVFCDVLQHLRLGPSKNDDHR